MPRNLEFGFYPRPIEWSIGDVRISTLPDLDEIVEKTKSSPTADDDWYHSPPERIYVMGTGVQTKPYPARVFALPKTHRIGHASAASDEPLIFHLWCLSFFLGMRLTSTEAGFLDAANLRPGALVDFIPVEDAEQRAIALADAFWIAHQATPEPSRLVSAIIHALFIAQTPHRLMFERFTHLYMSIDSCFALSKLLLTATPPRTHADRIDWMCRNLGLDTPAWADPKAPAGPVISTLRNQTFHEALFADQPLGFAAHNLTPLHEMMMDLQGLICRLLVALLGGQSDYIQTPLATRQRHGLALK